jgi:uncharacterized protein YoxC
MYFMSDALQVAVFVACAALTILVACVLPIIFVTHSRLGHVLRSTEQLKAELDPLVGETRELVRGVHKVGNQVNQQLSEFHSVVHAIENWAERADSLIDEVGSALEPPVLTVARNVSIVRAGMDVFFRILLRGNHSNKANQETNHV